MDFCGEYSLWVLCRWYAGGGAVGTIDDISDTALEPLAFLVGVLDSLTLDLEVSFSLPLDLDLEADLEDFLSSSFLALLSLLFLLFVSLSLLFSFFII